MAKQGLLISIEGMPYSGKTTQVEALRPDSESSEGWAKVSTGPHLRGIEGFQDILEESSPPVSGTVRLGLFAASRALSYDTQVEHRLAAGQNVAVDDFYSSFFRNDARLTTSRVTMHEAQSDYTYVEPEKVVKLATLGMLGKRIPELVIILDVPANDAFVRSSAHVPELEFEAEANFVQMGLLEMANILTKETDSSVRFVNARGSIDEVGYRVDAAVQSYVNGSL